MFCTICMAQKFWLCKINTNVLHVVLTSLVFVCLYLLCFAGLYFACPFWAVPRDRNFVFACMRRVYWKQLQAIGRRNFICAMCWSFALNVYTYADVKRMNLACYEINCIWVFRISNLFLCSCFFFSRIIIWLRFYVEIGWTYNGSKFLFFICRWTCRTNVCIYINKNQRILRFGRQNIIRIRLYLLFFFRIAVVGRLIKSLSTRAHFYVKCYHSSRWCII